MDLEIPKEVKSNVREYFSPKHKMSPDTPTTMKAKP
jgi:hypothetical protein